MRANQRFKCNGRVYEVGDTLPDDVADFAAERGYGQIDPPAEQPVKSPIRPRSKRKSKTKSRDETS